MSRKHLRFWLVYVVAWLPYAASYISLYVTHLGQNLGAGLRASVINVAPAALFGVGIVLVCQRLRWLPDRRYRILLVHLVLASGYVAIVTVVTPLTAALDQKIEFGQWSHQTNGSLRSGFFTSLLIYVTIAGVVYAVETTARLRAEEARAARAEDLRTRAQLETLRAQLNPHFLFNTLHTLMALVRHDPQAAEDALERLSLLLRHTLMNIGEGEDVGLSEEMDFIENYLALERLRLGERLRVERNIRPDSLVCRLPPFTLQPLVENSIKHAIAAQPDGGVLRINAERCNDRLCVEIIDDGPGAIAEKSISSNGFGLRVVRQRLLTRYGERASFCVNPGAKKGFLVRIEIPQDEKA